jgi:tetratricopeptide (TPR) repeat protein/tRNA A-37 threonylcarbamoyl transferase component Bud32
VPATIEHAQTDAGLATWAGASTLGHTPTPTLAELQPGAVIGRYVVLSRLGQGAMGVVYAAHDPQLGRKVAVKILHHEADDDEGRGRLLREAQALARLTHPNVVAIHDAGTLGERVWLAMEFVEGKTLGAWLKERRRPWPEVLRVLHGAGLGLAAAHDKGLVHRDFKPDNVMLTADGRALVMDFGLAKPEDQRPTASTVAVQIPTTSATSFDALAADLTRVGSVVGTPAYMAPEQFLALHIDARADQFAFCVALWEALFGERPFAGDSPTALCLGIMRGKLRPTPREVRVPAWLRRAVVRGLASEPGQRWPGMPALLAELARGQARSRRRRTLAVLAALASLAALAALAMRVDHQGRVRACDDLAAALPWDRDVEDRVRAAILATGASFATTTAERVPPGLAAWAERWRVVRRATCEHADVDRTWDPGLRARADECLAEHQARFTALVDALAAADASLAQQAVGAVVRLPAPDRCGQPHDLSLRPAVPDGVHTDVAAVRRQLARVATLDVTAQYVPAASLADEALARAIALDWPPLIAEARYHVGVLQMRAGEFKNSEDSLTAAYVTAGTAGAGEVTADAAIQLVAVARERAHHGEALAWGKAATVALAALGGGADDLRTAALAGTVAIVHKNAGNYAEARADNLRTLALRERLLGPDHPDVAYVLNNLANLEQTVGDFAAARPLLERAVQINTRAFGPDHPDVALSLGNLALVHYEQNDGAGARALHERALAIAEPALGPDHPTVAAMLANLATTHLALGEREPARDLYTRALAIEERVYGPDHPEVAASLTNLATIDGLLGDHPTARARHARALAIFERSLGQDHPDLSVPLVNLGETLLEQHDPAGAGRMFTRARTISEEALGPNHEFVARAVLGLADVAVAEARPPPTRSP